MSNRVLWQVFLFISMRRFWILITAAALLLAAPSCYFDYLEEDNTENSDDSNNGGDNSGNNNNGEDNNGNGNTGNDEGEEYKSTAGGSGQIGITVTSLTMLHPEIEVRVHESSGVIIYFDVRPESVANSIKWESSDPSVASMSSPGGIYPRKIGTTTITATINEFTAKCVVHVVDKPTNGVDMGVSVFWAQSNVGASAPYEPGDFLAWGEVRPKRDEYYFFKYYSLARRSGADYAMTAYDSIDKKTRLIGRDDAAKYRFGGGWRMPTYEEFKELTNNSTIRTGVMNGVHGYTVTSKKTGNTLFFPNTGYIWGDIKGECTHRDEDYPYLWTAERASNVRLGICYKFSGSSSSGSGYVDTQLRCYGLKVRPVFD